MVQSPLARDNRGEWWQWPSACHSHTETRITCTHMWCLKENLFFHLLQSPSDENRHTHTLTWCAKLGMVQTLPLHPTSNTVHTTLYTHLPTYPPTYPPIHRHRGNNNVCWPSSGRYFCPKRCLFRLAFWGSLFLLPSFTPINTFISFVFIVNLNLEH